MTVKVHFSSDLRGLTSGLTEVEVDDHGATVRELVASLDRRFPGLGERLGAGTAVMLGGEVIAHPDYEPVADGAEIYFIHQPSGG